MGEGMTNTSDSTSPFILWPDQRLTRSAQARPLDDELRAIGAQLLQAARNAQAYGLAAAHIGPVAPIIVVSVSEDMAARDYRLLFNPRVLVTDGPALPGREGSVSFPGIEVDIVRPLSARIAGEDETGAPLELALTGFPARVALHEIDQVNGVFFLSLLSRLKRDAALKRYAKLSRRSE